MELDDMKLAWQTLDRRLDTQAALNLQMYRDGRLDKTRSGLRPLVWGQAIQMLIGACVAIWAGGFWTAHTDVPHLLIAGLLVHLYGIGMIAFGAVMQALIARIDYAAPVVTIQRQIAQLRKVYIRGGMLIGLPWWLFWMPFMMVFFMWAFGADIYANAPSVIMIGTAVGVVGLFLTWLLRRWAARRPNILKRLDDSAAGRSIKRAQSYLDEIARFEKE